jgi:lysophospholipase L1-like esterase
MQSADEIRQLWENVVGPGHSYPTVLQSLLQSRYTAQAPSVSNEGAPGEKITENAAIRRFSDRFSQEQPDAVLLQEGINDLHQYGTDAISVIPTALRTMVREARLHGAQVFVGTLLPEHPTGCNAYAVPPSSSSDLIVPTNALIRAMAAAEGADLVDLYAAFQGRTGVLLGQDGLHPNEAGYSTIAKTFMRAIQQKLESPSSTAGAPLPDSPWSVN